MEIIDHSNVFVVLKTVHTICYDSGCVDDHVSVKAVFKTKGLAEEYILPLNTGKFLDDVYSIQEFTLMTGLKDADN